MEGRPYHESETKKLKALGANMANLRLSLFKNSFRDHCGGPEGKILLCKTGGLNSIPGI